MESRLKAAAGDDAEAYVFLYAFAEYFKQAMAFAESPDKLPGSLVRLCAETNKIYSIPFYVRNADMLYLSIMEALHKNDVDIVVRAVARMKLGYEKTLALPVVAAS